MITSLKKWDILKNKETALIGPCFGVSSQNSIKMGHIFPFDANNRAKTAPIIPHSI
jgi:hypothetical protein